MYLVKIAENSFEFADEVQSQQKMFNSTNIHLSGDDPIPECAEEEKNCLDD